MGHIPIDHLTYPRHVSLPIRNCPGGEGEIRTLGTVAHTPHFECGAFGHSATSPGVLFQSDESVEMFCIMRTDLAEISFNI